MTIFLAIDAKAGTINRYETGGGVPRKTHGVEIEEKPTEFEACDVYAMRNYPPVEFAVKRLCENPNEPRVA